MSMFRGPGKPTPVIKHLALDLTLSMLTTYMYMFVCRRRGSNTKPFASEANVLIDSANIDEGDTCF